MNIVTGKRAQTAYEFTFVFLFFATVFTVWTVFTSATQQRVIEEQQVNAIEDLGLRIQEELYTAQQMPNGFVRTITLPRTVAKTFYTLTIYEETTEHTFISIDNGKYTASYTIPNVITSPKPYHPNKTIILNRSAGVLHLKSLPEQNT